MAIRTREPIIAKEHFEYQITCIDSHIQKALRLAVNGIPSSVRQRYDREKKYFQDHYDFLSEQR